MITYYYINEYIVYFTSIIILIYGKTRYWSSHNYVLFLLLIKDSKKKEFFKLFYVFTPNMLTALSSSCMEIKPAFISIYLITCTLTVLNCHSIELFV